MQSKLRLILAISILILSIVGIKRITKKETYRAHAGRPRPAVVSASTRADSVTNEPSLQFTISTHSDFLPHGFPAKPTYKLLKDFIGWPLESIAEFINLGIDPQQLTQEVKRKDDFVDIKVQSGVLRLSVKQGILTDVSRVGDITPSLAKPSLSTSATTRTD